MASSIIVTYRFEGFHHWKDAPDIVEFLRVRHRHIFTVRVEIGVSCLDRELEFFIVKEKLKKFLNDSFENGELRQMSCEELARCICLVFNALRVEVWEDDENGGAVWVKD